RGERNPWNGVYGRDERLENRAEPVGTAKSEAHNEAACHSGDKAKERVLQGHGGGHPKIILIARQTIGEVAVHPAIEHAQLGLDAAQDQEIIEYLRWL